MEYVLFTETKREMQKMAARHDSVLVAFSGGKDSLVCLDLACKVFKRVIPFFMFFVPGLRCIDEKMLIVKDRYGLDVLQYPHMLYFRAIRERLYCTTSVQTESKIKEFGLTDIYKVICHDTGINLIINGSKETDNMSSKIVIIFYFFLNIFYAVAFCSFLFAFVYFCLLRLTKIPAKINYICRSQILSEVIQMPLFRKVKIRRTGKGKGGGGGGG